MDKHRIGVNSRDIVEGRQSRTGIVRVRVWEGGHMVRVRVRERVETGIRVRVRGGKRDYCNQCVRVGG